MLIDDWWWFGISPWLEPNGKHCDFRITDLWDNPIGATGGIFVACPPVDAVLGMATTIRTFRVNIIFELVWIFACLISAEPFFSLLFSQSYFLSALGKWPLIFTRLLRRLFTSFKRLHIGRVYSMEPISRKGLSLFNKMALWAFRKRTRLYRFGEGSTEKYLEKYSEEV